MLDKLRTRIGKRGMVVSESLWEEAKQHSELIAIKKNEILIEFGNRHKYAYFVVEGSFMSSMIAENGDIKAVWFHLDNLFEMALCLDSYFLDELSKYQIKAMEDSLVIKFNKQIVDQWVINYPVFNQFYIKDIINDYIEVNEIRAYKLANSPLDFLNYLNSKYPQIQDRVSSKNMAHFLGVSPEWYSKLKKKKKP